MIVLSKKQKEWLTSRGGRTEADVMKDEYGYYVLMGNGDGGLKKVYLPIYPLKE